MASPVNAHQVSVPVISDQVCSSNIMKKLNSLKEEVRSLKKDLSTLYPERNSSQATSSCHIYVHLLSYNVSEADLPSVINCPVLSATKVGFSWKVKIPRDCLHNALSSSSPHSHFVWIWRNKENLVIPHRIPRSSVPTTTETTTVLKVAAWNCRGLTTFKAQISSSWLFLHCMLSRTVASIPLQTKDVAEWLSSWRRASPLTFLDCDWMCGLQIEMANKERSLYILGVYMPSADQSQEVYSKQRFPHSH